MRRQNPHCYIALGKPFRMKGGEVERVKESNPRVKLGKLAFYH